MKLISLKLRGFRGVKSGMGIDELSVDFSALPDGLIAITGENGAGKTTVLDNCHPFRIMPYKLRKATGWSPGAFSFYDQCFGSDAVKELVFEMNGEVYLSRVLIDADRKKQEAYLFKQDNALSFNMGRIEWTPLNDGKTKTYDEAVERVVGSPTLFFTSVFRSQGARNLSDYTRGDIMAVLGELLNTDHIREQGQKCRDAISVLNDDLSLVRARVKVLETDLLAGEALEDQRTAAVERADRAKADRDVAAADEISCRGLISRLESSAALRGGFLSQLESVRHDLSQVAADEAAEEKDHRARLDSLDRDGIRRNLELTDMLSACRREQLTIQSELEADVVRLNARGAAIRTDIAGAERLLASGDLVRGDVVRQSELSARLLEIETARDKYQRDLRDALDAANNRISVSGRRAASLSEANRLKADRLREHRDVSEKIARAVATEGRLSGLDCRADSSGWVNGSCPLIKDAVAARDSLPMLRDTLSLYVDPSDEEADVVAEHLRLTAEFDALPFVDTVPLRNGVDTCNREHDRVSSDLRLLGDVSVRLAALEGAEGNIRKWSADLAAVEAESQALSERAALKLSGLAARQETIESDINEWRDHCSKSRETEVGRNRSVVSAMVDRRSVLVRQELDVLAKMGPDPADSLKVAVDRLDGILRFLSACDRELQQATLAVGQVDGKLAALEPLRVEARDLDGKEAALCSEIADLSLLLRACSNDGIIALELDDAAPSISSIVNDLLLSCYGPRFSVRLDTQAARADGSMKESFDIVVFDSETDDDRSIADCSGGQISIIEDTIVRGICLFNIHRQDRVFGTLFSDEKDGALSADKKREFLAVKRKSFDLGHHVQEFFISQTPELIEMADACILVGRGGVVIKK